MNRSKSREARVFFQATKQHKQRPPRDKRKNGQFELLKLLLCSGNTECQVRAEKEKAIKKNMS